MKNKLRNSFYTVFFSSGLTVLANTAMAGTIADVPLFISSSLDPNIMFLLDDSGSMNLSFTPDTLCSLGNTNRVKSSTVNKLYYNPAITYTPPVDANSASLGDSPYNAAWMNGYALPHPTSGTISSTGPRVNLDTQFRPTWSGGSTGCSDNNTYYGTAQRAYYYRYAPPQTPGCVSAAQQNTGNDSCYVKVTLPALTDTSASAAAQRQNFANWYSYYRTRMLTTKAGASRAFAQLGTTPRVGYARLNKTNSSTIDGVSTTTIDRGVRAFNGTDRTAFFNWLFPLQPQTYTPSRRALDAVGQYYSREDDLGPWSSTPGTAGGSLQACRQSYTVLMTDGYWNDAQAGTTAARADNDSTTTNNMTIAKPSGETYTYTPASPFKDCFGTGASCGTSSANTLADVAMYYWKRDLCPTLANQVPVSTTDPAFWQHMVLFGIGLGVPTVIDPDTAFAAIPTGNIIHWPDPVVSDTDPTSPPAARIDDLLHASVNSRGAFFNAQAPDEFANALNDTLTSIIDKAKNSASSVATNSLSMQTDSMIYQATFRTTDWSGKLKAFTINSANCTIDTSAPNWDASLVLPNFASRNIYTLNPNATAPTPKGVQFLWNNLTSTPAATSQQTYLNTLLGINDGCGALRLNWLRGDTNSVTCGGNNFRSRTNVLGDIINSDPAYVGTQDYGYSTLTGTEGNSYAAFVSGKASRRLMIYTGANDGMLHGFDARKNGAGSPPVTTGGVEVFAYIPNALFPKLSLLTDSAYSHRYYVDGASSVGDAYISNPNISPAPSASWHTMLAGTTGAGGRAAFMLDVTDPDSFGANNVYWEFTNGNDADLGYTLAQPSIVRMHNGSWAVVLANGYNSDNGHAVLFILNAETGAVIKKIDTGVGSTANKNGLSTPLAVDTDNDRITDYIYAGDLYGNFWKFKVTDTLPDNWDVAYRSAGNAQPLFVACTVSGTTCSTADRQPITAKPSVGQVSGSDQTSGIMLYFGTGKYFEVGDNAVSASPQTQTFYGLWDKNTGTAPTDQIPDRANLQSQTIDYEGPAITTTGLTSTTDIRITSANPVCYATTSTSCTVTSPLKRGWTLNLIKPVNVSQGERVVSVPLVRRGLVIFVTLIPNPDPCGDGGTGWLMELNALTGKRTDAPAFDIFGGTASAPTLGKDNKVDGADLVRFGGGNYSASGTQLGIGIPETPGIVEDDAHGVDYKYVSGSNGEVGIVTDAGATPPPPGGGSGTRQSWRQLR